MQAPGAHRHIAAALPAGVGTDYLLHTETVRNGRVAANFVALLIVVGSAMSCASEAPELTHLRKVAETLPVPAGTELLQKDFLANRPGMFDDEQFSGTLQYLTLSEVDLEATTNRVAEEFESAGWNVTRQSEIFDDENLVAQKGSFEFRKDGETGNAYISYVIPPIDVPIRKPAKVQIVLALNAT